MVIWTSAFGTFVHWSKESELVEEAAKYRLDIVGVSESKLKGKGNRDLDNGWKLFYSGIEDPRTHAQAGVGILTSPRMAEQVIEWSPKIGRASCRERV